MGLTFYPNLLYALLASVATCTYVHRYGLRGDIFLVCTLAAYVGLACHFIKTETVFQSLIHATNLTCFYLGCVMSITVLYRLSPMHPLASFPGPLLNRITSIRMAVAAASGKRHLYVADLHSRYGTFVRLAPNKLSINSLAAIHPIYASSQALDKSEAYRPGRSHDDALFFMRDRAKHSRRRKIWAHAFTPAALQAGEKTLNYRTQQLVECIARRRDAAAVVDLGHCIEHWTFDLMGDLTFGGSNGIEFMQEGDPMKVVNSVQTSVIMFEVLGEVPSLFDLCSWLPVIDDYRAMEKLAARLIAARKETSPKNGSDLCSLFLAQGEENTQPPLNDEDLLADTVFAIAAGSDTIAAVTTITIFLLLNNPSAYAALTHELDTHFPSGGITASDHTALLALPYLAAVISEGLRLGTPFPGFPRVVPAGGAVIDGQYVPGGTTVAVPAYAQQLSPDNFAPHAPAFKPERWLPEGLGVDTVTRREALMTFQFGPFGCLGKSMALRQLSVVLATLLLAYELAFAPGFSPRAFFDGWTNLRTNVLKYPLRVEVRPRSR